MMRALFAAASGMKAQQRNIDLISNNIANVNTNGFKGTRAAFKDLLYSDMEIRRVEEPPNLQVGNGVRMGASIRSFIQGALIQTGNALDLAIEGDGFFAVAGEDGSVSYTRDGSFKVSSAMVGESMVSRLTTADGLHVLNSEGDVMEFDAAIDASDVRIGADGSVMTADGNGEETLVGRLALVRFVNPAGLQATGSNRFIETPAGGEGVALLTGEVRQGFVEASNVELADEMTRLILAQRAYQIGSRVLQAADDMEGMANNLRR